MGDKNLYAKLGLIVLLVGMSAWAVWPPGERLKPGIDLGGGHSLTFEIDDTDYKDSDLAKKVMQVLKNRIDPQGNRNLVWRPIGRNRLEIQMPQPTEKQASARKEFDRLRETLIASNITLPQIRTRLELPPAQRDAEFKKLTGIVESRGPLFEKLVQADQEYKRLSAEYEAARAANSAVETQPAGEGAATRPTTQAVGRLASDTDKALKDRLDIEKQLLDTNVDVRKLTDLLALDRKAKARVDALEELRRNHPWLTRPTGESNTPLLDQLVDVHDTWAKNKGALEDPSDLIRLLRGAGVLEYRILPTRGSNPDMIETSSPAINGEPVEKYANQLSQYGPRKREGDNFAWFKIAKPDDTQLSDPPYIISEYAGSPYILACDPIDPEIRADMTLLHGQGQQTWSLKSARPGMDDLGRNAIYFTLDNRGGEKFGRMTGANIERPLCIFMDGEAISAATIQSRIYSSGQITGDFSPEEVMYMVNTLEAGALPGRLKEVPLQEKSIGPSLGATNRDKGVYAVFASFIAVIVFMALYYTYNGLIANIALFMNLIITLGIMSFLQATFTLPGMAGLVLTLGMAVDANVLIYERMREELQRGVSARMAVKLGYEKAFSAILDSNVTTIITAVILGWLGSEEIKGFGLTLGIGLCTSLFTALFVTRMYFNIMVPATLNKEEVRKTGLAVGIVAIGCGLLLGLGWLLNSPRDRDESTLYNAGVFLAWIVGTAVVLIGSMMVFRWLYRLSGHQRANRLPMLKLLSAPNIDWMKKYKLYWTISAFLIFGGMVFSVVTAELAPQDVLDIEFLGGTSVEVALDEQHQEYTEAEVAGYIGGDDPKTAEGWLNAASGLLAEAQVTAAGDARYLVKIPGDLTIAQAEALITPTLGKFLARGGVTEADGGVAVQINGQDERAVQAVPDAATLQELIRTDAAAYIAAAAVRVGDAKIQMNTTEVPVAVAAATRPADQPAGVATRLRKNAEIITTETSRPVVSEAVLAAMSGVVEATRPIEAKLVTTDDDGDGIFPIPMGVSGLADVIGGDTAQSVEGFKGGLVMVFDNLDPPQTRKQIEERLKAMRLQPDFEDVVVRKSEVVGLEPAEGAQPIGGELPQKKVAIMVVDPVLLFAADGSNDQWKASVADKELALTRAAFADSSALQRVTLFAAQVAGEAAQRALIAIILSFIAIAGYLWVRFGAADYGLAGIIALYHDVAITLTAIIACHFFSGTFLGKMLMLEGFRIDLNIIAALLTIVGFSINDTIVIFDRIRENRGRMVTVSSKLINDSLNQTLSRTILTSLTVFMTVLVMYIFGGAGIHGFAFAMLVGTLSGTYSTIAIATPMIQHPRAMWLVTIVLATATLLGMLLLIPWWWMRIPLMVVMALLAAAALVKVFAATATTGRRPAMA